MSMWPLAGDGYSTQQVDDALHAPLQVWRFVFERRSIPQGFNGYLQNVISASISFNAKQAIRRTARFSMLDDGSFEFGVDRIHVWAHLRMSDGGYRRFPCGKFLTSNPPRKQGKAGIITRDVQAYDYTQMLSWRKATSRYTIASGTAYTSAMASLLTPDGILSSIVTSAATLPATRDWQIGTSYLQILTDLLDAVNYRPFWMDAMGIAQIMPYTLPQSRNPEYTYNTDSKSLVAPGAEQALDLTNVPNQFIVVVSQPDRSVLSSTYTNSNPLSPSSTASRGVTITQMYKSSDAVDQTTLDAIAKRIASDESQVYETVSFNTPIMPIHGDNDVYTLSYRDLGLNAKYAETAWTMPLKAGAMMSHTIQRIVTV